MYFLLMSILVWLFFNLAIAFALCTRRPIPERRIPPHLRRAL